VKLTRRQLDILIESLLLEEEESKLKKAKTAISDFKASGGVKGAREKNIQKRIDKQTQSAYEKQFGDIDRKREKEAAAAVKKEKEQKEREKEQKEREKEAQARKEREEAAVQIAADSLSGAYKQKHEDHENTHKDLKNKVDKMIKDIESDAVFDSLKESIDPVRTPVRKKISFKLISLLGEAASNPGVKAENKEEQDRAKIFMDKFKDLDEQFKKLYDEKFPSNIRKLPNKKSIFGMDSLIEQHLDFYEQTINKYADLSNTLKKFDDGSVKKGRTYYYVLNSIIPLLVEFKKSIEDGTSRVSAEKKDKLLGDDGVFEEIRLIAVKAKESLEKYAGGMQKDPFSGPDKYVTPEEAVKAGKEREETEKKSKDDDTAKRIKELNLMRLGNNIVNIKANEGTSVVNINILNLRDDQVSKSITGNPRYEFLSAPKVFDTVQKFISEYYNKIFRNTSGPRNGNWYIQEDKQLDTEHVTILLNTNTFDFYFTGNSLFVDGPGNFNAEIKGYTENGTNVVYVGDDLKNIKPNDGTGVYERARRVNAK
jgi:hypothetical protein